MDHFTAHRLQFDLEVQTPIELNAHQGSAIRGALFHALRDRFCANPAAPECSLCPLSAGCPVCTLVSTLNPDADGGRDVPRPFTVQPPLAPADGEEIVRHEPGARLSFGLTLYARAMQLFPYVVMAVRRLEENGIGRKVADNGWRRGRFAVTRVSAVNPLTGERCDVLHGGDTRVAVPDIPITHEQVMSGAGPVRQATVEFLTPTRLIAGGRLIKPMDLTFRVLLARLFDRIESLSREFSDTPLALPFVDLLRQAESVRLAGNETRWVELSSYSTRQGRSTPIGGLVGQCRWEAGPGDLSRFLPWLTWGAFVHVGKDAVKGNGWYLLSVE